MKPNDEVRQIGKYHICDDCYNTKREGIPSDLEIKIPDGGIYYGFSASYHPLMGEINLLHTFSEYRCEEILSHEFFHQTLLKHIGWEGCLMWDNISGCGEIEREVLNILVDTKQ